MTNKQRIARAIDILTGIADDAERALATETGWVTADIEVIANAVDEVIFHLNSL